MQHAKQLVKQKLDEMEQPIQSIEANNSLLVKLHLNLAQM